ncbi:hypothetical protein PI124_g3498 [Phytophthora idaei]|nr:hypothetical protein PI125_g2862 [Phytophthora idaei]KAG3173659.1 hypothetical protein PI126_g712 [Phytophthora idaei]KAG3251882.1 hypothetical protein PI124_g3498 [Phytophthora idaei]
MDIDEDVLLAAVVTCESAVVDTLWVASKKEKTNILTLLARSIDAMLADHSYGK